MENLFFRLLIIKCVFCCNFSFAFSAQENKQEELWNCYPVYSSAPDKDGKQICGGMYCYINKENSKEIPERFMIVGENVNASGKKRSVIIYSTEYWWRGVFFIVRKIK